jgi:hypothetical protein
MSKKKIRNKKHSHKCPCNSGVAMQYALKPFKGGAKRLVAIEESVLFDTYLEQLKHNPDAKQPVFEHVMPENEEHFIVVYGMLHPQHASYGKVSDWNEELSEWKNVAHGTILDGKLYMSAFADFKLFPELSAAPKALIPCALLLTTALNFEGMEERFGFEHFGYTSSIAFANHESLDNIANRPYLFCLQKQEPVSDELNKDNWTNYIDVAKLIRLAKISL